MNRRFLAAWVGDIDLHLSMLAIVILIGITFAGVLMRYAANSPFVWLDEMQMICMLWGTCFGASAAFRHGGHIAIDMLVNLFPAGLRKAAGALVFLLVLFMLGFLAWNSYGLVRQQFLNNRVSDIMRLPRGYIYAALPLAAAGMLISHFRNAVQALRAAPEKE